MNLINIKQIQAFSVSMTLLIALPLVLTFIPKLSFPSQVSTPFLPFLCMSGPVSKQNDTKLGQVMLE